MITFALISLSFTVLINLLYFKAKHDKLLFPMLSAVIFSVIVLPYLYLNYDTESAIKTFAALSLLHLCGTNDIIRHESDDIFPLLIIAAGAVRPTNLIYMVISLVVTVIMFIIIILFSKNTIGGGDIKMICALSFFFGLNTTITAIIAACISGIIYAVVIKLSAKLPDFNKRFAFLPFVEIGYLTALLFNKG